MSLDQFSDEALETELALRKEAYKKFLDKPKPISKTDMNWDILIEYIQLCVEDKNNTGYESANLKRYVFEKAMEVVYGTDIWKWWNSHG